MAADFEDITPKPIPTPKKRYLLTPGNSNGLQPIAWPSGVTFKNALAAAFPAAIGNKTNATDFKINIVIDAEEL